MAARLGLVQVTWVLLLVVALAACRHGAATSSSRTTARRPAQEKPASTVATPKVTPAQKEAQKEAKRKKAESAKEDAAAAKAPRKTTLNSTKTTAKPAVTNAVASDKPTSVDTKKSGSHDLLGTQVSVSPEYDEELRRIIDLARRNKWEEAEARASALYALDPKDSAVQRVYSWVKTEGPKRREKVLEDDLRDITAKNSRFNPSIKSWLTDGKNKGLPPRSDLREAIDQIKATPYIPESYGRTIQSKGTLEDASSGKGKMSALLDKEIEVHLDNVPLENIIFNVGQTEGINFIADKSIPAFQQKLSVNMKGVKLAEFLSYVSRNLNVKFQVGGDLIWIVDGKNTNEVQKETRFFRLRKGFVLPAQFGLSDATRTTVRANNVATTTEVQKFENFVRDGAPQYPSIQEAIKNFCEDLTYYIDYEHNIIIAQGDEEDFRILERIIEEFDKPIPQVLIEARFITVTESTFLKLGAVWETGRNTSASARTSKDYTGLGENVGLGLEESWSGQEMFGTNNWVNVMGSTSLTATLTAIDQSGESEVLSAPRVTVINNLPARISDGKIQYYYEEYRIAQTTTERRSASTMVPSGKPVSINAGVSLDVLASVGGDGRTLSLALNPEVNQDVKLVTFATISDRNSKGQLTSSFDLKLPEARKQTVATRVVIRSGQTVVMGGVLQREQRTFVEATPILGNLPIIGAAFRRRTEVDNPRYLLVFVTATLISENGEFIVSQDAE